MAITINAKATSNDSFAVGKGGVVFNKIGSIDIPDTYNFVVNLDANKHFLLNPVTGNGLITTSAGRDLELDPTVGGGTYLLFNGLRWPTADGTSNQILQTNGSGVLSWTSAGSGSVTDVSVVTTNGFAGSVATSTTTPAITLSTTVTGVLKGNGTAISAASASDITSLVDGTYVNIDGDTMTGTLNVPTLNVTGNTTLGDATTDTVSINGYIGVGGAGNSGRSINIVSTALTGTAQFGIYSTPTNSVAGTSQLTSMYSSPIAANNVTTVRHYYADNATGAGTVTTQVGLDVLDLTKGSTNIGAQLAVSSGANKWNVYASGTASNYFAGNVGIGTNSPGSLLHINANNASLRLSEANTYYGSIQVDSGGGLTIAADPTNVAANSRVIFSVDNTERVRIDATGNVGIGTTTPYQGSTVDASRNSSSLYASSGVTAFPFTTTDPVVTISNINSTSGTASYLNFRTQNATSGVNLNYIASVSTDGSVTPSLVFGARTTGGYEERLRIDNNGSVLIAKTTRNVPATDNDLSFDLDAKNNFICTPTGAGTLTFTVSAGSAIGQSGFILLKNTSNYAISVSSSVKCDSNFLSVISTTGTYLISYFVETHSAIYVVTSNALA